MPKPSSSSARVRYLDKDTVLLTLRHLAQSIGAERSEVSQIRLFGSLARGERNPYADADWLVIVDFSTQSPRDRIPAYKPVGSPVPMDITVCTRAELDRELAAGNRFLQRILAESILLYQRSAA